MYLRAVINYSQRALAQIIEADGSDALEKGRALISSASNNRYQAKLSMQSLLHAYTAARKTFGPHTEYESEALMESLWSTHMKSQPVAPWLRTASH